MEKKKPFENQGGYKLLATGKGRGAELLIFSIDYFLNAILLP